MSSKKVLVNERLAQAFHEKKRPCTMQSPYRALRFLVPGCFAVGAGMEWFMINVPIGGRTFYDVAKEKKEERLQEALEEERAFIARREERRKRLAEVYGADVVAQQDK